MALELLAGPFTVTDGDGDPIALSVGQTAFYDDALGLCLYSGDLGGYSVVQLDGMAYLRGAQARANAFVVDLQQPGEYLIHDSLFSNKLYTFNKHAGAFGDLLLSGGDAFVSGLMVRCVDRYLSVFSGSVLWKPLTADASFLSEATLTNAGSGDPTISRTREDNIICIAYNNGPIVFYDVIEKTQVDRRAFIGTNSGAWYSRKHNIFVAIVSSQIKVFANAVRPAVLTNPDALSALTQGRVSDIRVRVTGANSDVCAGELVDWSMTGDGELAALQSATDADGYAYNKFLAPVSGTGSATISAEVKF